MRNWLKEIFFEKVDFDSNYSIAEIKTLSECLDTLCCENCEAIVLLDSKGIYISSKMQTREILNNYKFKYMKLINNTQLITKEDVSVYVKEFNRIKACPGFYVLIKPMTNRTIDIDFIGKSIQNIYLLLDSYKKEYDRLLLYLDSIQDGISAVDKKGVLIYTNKACCNILDVKKEDLIGKKVDSLSENRTLLRDVLRTKESKIDIEYFLDYRNRVIHVTNSGFPVFDDNNRIQGAIDVFRSIDRSRNLVNAIAGHSASFGFNDIVGKSSQIISTVELAKKCALLNGDILIEGESGTGKELFAQSIHNYSSRNEGPFIAINCASLPNELVESELFGYEEGAFTGAKKGGKAGKFELANKGTLFLDEIGDMPIHIQAKLLRAVEYKTICRIGGSRIINIDVRIVAATNRDLELMVKQDKFRGDLFYRLKVLYLRIPPLRERNGDIIELSKYFLRKTTQKMRKDIQYIDDEAKEYLMSYSWPGNIRELENSIARAIFLCDDTVLKREHLIKAGVIDSEISYKKMFSKGNIISLDYVAVNETYQSTLKNKKRTAELLGISRPTLYKLIKKYNIE